MSPRKPRTTTRRLSRRERELNASRQALALDGAAAVEALGVPPSATDRGCRNAGLINPNGRRSARCQYRRFDWEEAGGIDPETGEQRPEPILADPPYPVLLPRPPEGDVEAEAEFRAAKVLVMRRRHELRRKLWVEGDARRTMDVPDALHRLALEMMHLPASGPVDRASATFQTLVSGVYQYRDRYGRPTARWRAYPWVVDLTKPIGTRGQKGEKGKRRIHLGYHDCREKALAAVLRYRVAQGYEVETDIPAWMGELMKLATRQTTAVSLA